MAGTRANETVTTDRLASGEVHAMLRDRILGEELQAGDALPSERSLSEQFGVNRHAVREALKRLQQAGLVRITQGGATRVLDWRESAGLDLLLDLVRQGTDPPDPLLRSVLEMRACIGADAAGRCAARAAPESRRSIAAGAETAAALAEAGDSGLEESFVSLWRQIVDGSDNLAYRLSLNSLNATLTEFPELGESLTSRDPELLRNLGRAIEEGRPEKASAAASSMLEADAERDVSPARSRP